MKQRPFKVSSFRDDVDYVIVEKDSIGWKLDAIGYDTNEIPNGDTYQDTLDEFMPFLKLFIDERSVWSDWNTGEKISFWRALSDLTEDF